MIFTLEWCIYNIVTIFIVITIVTLCVTGFFIYRRHKKYGLGPRYLSILYIDGLNIKSIGNILCIIGIILAILGLLYPWYTISYDISALNISQEFRTTGMTDLLKLDGLDGLQVKIPGQNGFTPLGAVAIPFSVFIAIGIIFMIIATIGIYHSKKLGRKYIWKGIRLLIPIILILVAIIALGGIVKSVIGENQGADSMTQVLNEISSSPFGGERTFNVGLDQGVTASIDISWGLGLGAILLLLSGIIIIISGILEIMANTQFFTTKIPIEKLSKKVKSAQTPQPVQPAPKEGKFCTECGKNLTEKDTFCTNCGKKVK